VKITILSLFPSYFAGPFDESMIKRARAMGLVDINLVDIRDFADDKHRRVDDHPYGGGPGMLMMPGPVVKSIRANRREKSRVIYLSPQGEKLSAGKARALSKEEDLIFLCGHYEGIDERALLQEVDESLSIGDYVLTSGCPAAIVVVDAVVRFIPGVLGDGDSCEQDSFEGDGSLEGPQYTRPYEFEGLLVPPVLISGHHKEIDKWKKEQSAARTVQARPDLKKFIMEKL
jgi:tRNA (guanine-N1)-methyltransferase